MKTMIAAAAALAMLGGAATLGTAYAGTIENAFGNTLLVQAGEASMSFRFEPNNTYAMTAPDGAVVTGRWVVNGAQICLTPAGGAAECHPYDASKNVGDTWTVQESDGSSATLTIRRGR